MPGYITRHQNSDATGSQFGRFLQVPIGTKHRLGDRQTMKRKSALLGFPSYLQKATLGVTLMCETDGRSLSQCTAKSSRQSWYALNQAHQVQRGGFSLFCHSHTFLRL